MALSVSFLTCSLSGATGMTFSNDEIETLDFMDRITFSTSWALATIPKVHNILSQNIDIKEAMRIADDVIPDYVEIECWSYKP